MDAPYRPVRLDTWPRREHYAHFAAEARCFVTVTHRLDVTGLRTAARRAGESFFGALLYCVTRVINRRSEFRLATLPGVGGPVEWEEVHPVYPVFHDDDETFTCVCTRHRGAYAAFRDACRRDIAVGRGLRGYQAPGIPPNVFCVSALPWLGYTSFELGLDHGGGRPFLAPIVTWGRAEPEPDGRIRLPLTFQIHHAAADGFHVARFFSDLAAETVALAASFGP